MNNNLKNKTILITGASGDIGSACAELFLNEGAAVILHYHKNFKRIKEITKKFSNSKIYIIKCDATKDYLVKKQFEILNKKYKIKKIDGLVNAVGDLIKRIKIEDTKWSFVKKVLEVNIKSAFLFTTFCLPLMKKKFFYRIYIIINSSLWKR